jgi:hypothetical protein
MIPRPIPENEQYSKEYQKEGSRYRGAKIILEEMKCK